MGDLFVEKRYPTDNTSKKDMWFMFLAIKNGEIIIVGKKSDLY
ncbi:MAG: hypothetical protein ACRD8Z_10470 [Nitrososphaeraceae archaeon]